MHKLVKAALLIATHLGAIGVGFALGIYFLPILTAPPGPELDSVRSAAQVATYSGEFKRDLTDSDALHWGEGNIFITEDAVAFQGQLAPGPDYRLYFAPEFVETEADFLAMKSSMVQAGLVRTFENFMVPLPASIDPSDYTAVIIWCETFGQFITAATYR